MLIDSNSLYALFFVNSIIEPLWVKLIYFMLEININFFLSALFFSDDIIDKRSQIPKEIRDSPLYTFINEQKKILLTLLFAFIFELVMGYVTKIPSSIEDDFNEDLKTKDKKLIKRK